MYKLSVGDPVIVVDSSLHSVYRGRKGFIEEIKLENLYPYQVRFEKYNDVEKVSIFKDFELELC